MGWLWHRGWVTSTSPAPSRVAVPAVAVGIVAVVAFVTLVEVALRSQTGQSIDDRAMATVVAGREARLTVLSVLGRVSVVAVAVVAAGCVLLAAVRRHWGAALGAVVLIGGSNMTTQALKHGLLDRPDLGYGVHNSLPSGHVTVVAAAVAALLIVVPSGIRASVAGIGTFAVALTGLSTIVAGWHRPADVVAALLVVLGWSAVGVLVTGGTRAAARGTLLTSLSGAIAALVGTVLIGVRPVAGLDGFVDAALVLGCVALVTALVISLIAWLCPSNS